MKLLKSSIVVIGFCVLFGTCFTVSAGSITDGTGDVFHWTGSGTAWSWRQNNNRDNIDITEVSSTVNGDKITISLKVVGTIQTTEKFGYYYYYNTSDSTYMVFLMGSETGFAIAQNQGAGSYDSGNVTHSGNTVSAEFNVLGDTVSQEIWGYAVEWTEVGPDATTHESWGDWAPNAKFTGIVNASGDGGGGDITTPKPSTPGFEAIAVIAAMGAAFIILKRRK